MRGRYGEWEEGREGELELLCNKITYIIYIVYIYEAKDRVCMLYACFSFHSAAITKSSNQKQPAVLALALILSG